MQERRLPWTAEQILRRASGALRVAPALSCARVRWHDSTPPRTDPSQPRPQRGAVSLQRQSEEKTRVPLQLTVAISRDASLPFRTVPDSERLRICSCGETAPAASGWGAGARSGRRGVPAHACTTSAGATRRARVARRGMCSSAKETAALAARAVRVEPQPPKRTLFVHRTDDIEPSRDNQAREPTNAQHRRSRWGPTSRGVRCAHA